MNMERNEEKSMEELMDKIDVGIKSIRKGDIVKGKVISVNDNEAIVNIGYMSDGIIPKNEISFDKEVNPKDVLSVDDEIFVYISQVNDGEGNVSLSKKIADSIVVWDELKELMESGKVFNIKCEEVVKGGVISHYKGIRAFIPASQLSVEFVKDLNEFVGKELEVKIIEVNKENKKFVLSAREVEKAKLEVKREELWNSLKEGQKVRGKVRKLTKFGAFVDLGGVDGLIHLSELSWHRVKDPSEVVSVGEEVEVYILNIDKDKKRIALSYKESEADPWKIATEKFAEGSVAEGTVVKLVDFGAFVELEDNIQGLVHVSQISEEMVSKPSNVLSVGDKVKVKILSFNPENKRISLSIKDAVEKVVEDFGKYNDEDEAMMSLGELFKDKFKNLDLK